MLSAMHYTLGRYLEESAPRHAEDAGSANHSYAFAMVLSQLASKRGIGNVMVSHCANPDCRRELHYLREGKIYQFILSPKTGSKRLEHFWLCGECSKKMTLICVNQSEVKTANGE